MSNFRCSQFRSTLLTLIVAAGLFSGCSDTPEKLFARGQENMQAQNWIGAYIYFQEFLEKFPDDPYGPDVMIYMTQCNMQLGEFAEARQRAEEMVEKYPREDVVLRSKFLIGDAYFAEGKLDEGRNVYREVLDATAPLDARLGAINRIAQSHISEASYTLARGALEQAVALAVESASEIAAASAEPSAVQNNFRFWAADTYRQEDDFQGAANAYAALGDNPTVSDIERANALFMAADSLDRVYRNEDRNIVLTGEAHDSVLAAYRKVVEQYPENDYAIWSRVEIARILRDDNNKEEAEKLVEEAVQRYEKIIADPIDERQIKWAMAKVGDANLRLERLKEARTAFMRLFHSFPDDPQNSRLAQWRVNEIDGLLSSATGTVESGSTTVEAAGDGS